MICKFAIVAVIVTEQLCTYNVHEVPYARKGCGAARGKRVLETSKLKSRKMPSKRWDGMSFFLLTVAL